MYKVEKLCRILLWIEENFVIKTRRLINIGSVQRKFWTLKTLEKWILNFFYSAQIVDTVGNWKIRKKEEVVWEEGARGWRSSGGWRRVSDAGVWCLVVRRWTPRGSPTFLNMYLCICVCGREGRMMYICVCVYAYVSVFMYVLCVCNSIHQSHNKEVRRTLNFMVINFF